MAGLPRQSSLMPTIKCSSCNELVEISMMGEHVCGGGADSIDTFMPFNKGIHDKISVIPPVDTAMANRSYLRQPLTPMSLSSGSRSVSPRTPSTRPSIDKSNDYFTPQIANDDRNSSQQPLRSGGYGGFSDADFDPGYAATSPKKQSSGLLTRMDAIAPGPFGSGNAASPPRGFSQEMERPGTSASSFSTGAGTMAPPPRAPRKNDYGGFGPPRRGEDEETDGFPGPERSRTFPRPRESLEPPPRTPSAPGPRPDRYRQPSTDMNGRMAPDTSRAPPPRTSLVRPPTGGSNTLNINLAEEFGAMNPYHSPSVSVSSSLSQGSSHRSNPSSSTSPARSATSARKPSNTSNLDNLMTNLQSSMEELDPKELPPTSEMGGPTSPVRRQTALSEDRSDPAIQGGRRPSPPPLRRDRGDSVDPAIQGGLRSGSSPLPPAPRRDPAVQPSRNSRDPAVRRSRGNCKSCGEAITGKSVSSADGRLTGRYHKACFVCTSCREPFQTAEFYVHGDRPYCKYHYHQVNGSLCGSCTDGIEGQYLEDESTKKYHVNCFRCGDCQVVLRDGYFEVDGRAYCEKDAWRRLQPQQYRRSPSMSSQRSYPGSKLAPPGRQGMRGPPGVGIPHRPGQSLGNGRLGPPMGGVGTGLPPPGPMPRMEKRRTRLGMM